MAHPSPSTSRSSSNTLIWRPTKVMNMQDLSKDDDFLSHLLVEKLGTGIVPLLVHKMDSSRRLPKTNTLDLMRIVRRLVASKGSLQQAVRHAVDELLLLPPIRYYLKPYTQKQINAFATHAARYFELYHPSGSIEIAHTSRYAHHTGKSELCILATRNLTPGTVVTELKGSMANLTDEEDRELKRTDLGNSDIRRDFSVIHSKSMKKNHLFLGPARFVNHDCDNNCELFREGRYITFRVIRPIAIGEEITAHYGDGYFGKKNRHCLCETCEKNGRGGYSPEHADEANLSSDSSSESNSDSEDSDSDTSSSSESECDKENPVLNVNERRTRRGVYAISKLREDDSDDNGDNDDDNKMPLADANDVPADGEIKLTAEIDTGWELTSLAPSVPPPDEVSPIKDLTPGVGVIAPIRSPTPVRVLGISRSSSSLTDLSSSSDGAPKSNQSTPFRSIISTRRQKARAEENAGGTSLLDNASSTTSVSSKRLTRSVSSLVLSDEKGKARSSQTPCSTPSFSKMANNDSPVKKPEHDSRILRTRLPVAVGEGLKDSVQKPDVPMGLDGKPLPTCSTCSNILPLISVDSQVVWGLSLDVGREANQKHDCPRCIRHFAIYEQRWPFRVPPHGTSPATPRAENTPVEQRHTVRIGTNMSSTAHKAKNLDHDEHEEEVVRPFKRLRTLTALKCPLPKRIVQQRAAYAMKMEEEERRSRSQKALPVHIVPKVSSSAYKAKNVDHDEHEREVRRPFRKITARKRLTPPRVLYHSVPYTMERKTAQSVRIDPKASSSAKNVDHDEHEKEVRRPFRKITARKRLTPPRIVYQRPAYAMKSSAYKAKNFDEHDEHEEEESRPFKRRRTMVTARKRLTPPRIVYQRPAYAMESSTYKAKNFDEHDEHEEEESRPFKRRRTMVTARKRLTPPRIVYQRSAYTMEMARTMAFDRNTSETVKRKRGRPRLLSPRVISNTKVKVEELQVDIPVVAQPRATNGRFGKKEKSWRKSHEYTAVGSTTSDDDDDLEPKSPRRKRDIDAVGDFEEPAEKRSASEQNPKGGNELDVIGPGQKVLPRPASGFRGGRLFSNPNPLRFALHAWAGPLILDESSDDDEKQPETPEDILSSVADIAPTEELMDSMLLPSSILPRAPPLTCKPSPFVFAKNRWNATSATLNKVADNNRRASTNSTPSDDNLRTNLRTDHVSLKEEAPRLSAADSSYLYSMPEGYPSAVWSDDETHLSKLRHVYPVLPAAAASMMYIPKSTAFPSQNSEPKPTFINAGWGDSSEGSEL